MANSVTTNTKNTIPAGLWYSEYNPLADPSYSVKKDLALSNSIGNAEPTIGILSSSSPQSMDFQISSFGKTPTATATANTSTGIFDRAGNWIKDVGNSIVDGVNSVGNKIQSVITDYEYSQLQDRPYSIIGNSEVNPNYYFYYSPEEIQALKERPYSLQTNYMAQDASKRADVVDNYYKENSAVTNATDSDIWTAEDWDNAKFALDVGKFGFDLYTRIMGLNYAKDALDETRTNNAYNRRLSAWQANNDAQAYNTSLQARLASRQKFNTGSTAGADKLYEQNKLTPFKG